MGTTTLLHICTAIATGLAKGHHPKRSKRPYSLLCNHCYDCGHLLPQSQISNAWSLFNLLSLTLA
eukprot:10247099-Karenia_brevis.AAC.1